MGRAEPAQPAGGAAPRGQALRVRELEIVREIAESFLTAAHALEVYRLALLRLTPLVRASFGSVFLRDPAEPELLKLECAHNWPQASAPYLAQFRIRVGRGPTGRAVSECVAVEVSDIFADPALRDWWDAARELGFTAMISLPLVTNGHAAGALSFYYEASHHFTDEERHVLDVLAAQLAATTCRAHLIDELRASNLRLQRQNEALLERIGEAEQVKRLRDEFLANISHELRTPLTAILGYAHLLTQGQLGELAAKHAEVVAKIDRSANVLRRLIDDLLELTQIKLGRVGATNVETDAVLLAKHAAEVSAAATDEVTFAVRTTEPRLTVVTDAEKVVKVLSCLLDNAFKFTSEGEVELSVRSADEASAVEWQVRDTGIGIAAADHAAIFDEFRQVDGTSTRLYGGTGLGLSLCRRIARLLGGTITVESEPGVGSTFTLRLPRRPEPAG
jgi:signal transduction histidine kinase